MSSFFVLGIYFLLFSGDGEIVGWNHFLHGGSVEDVDNNYGIGILTDFDDMETFIFEWRHQDGDGVAAME